MTKDGNNVVKMFPDQPSAIELFGDDGYTFPEKGDPDLEEVHRDGQIQTLVTVCSNRVAQELLNMDMDPMETPHEFCFIVESIVSYILKHHDIDHELQDLSHMTIMLEDEEQLIFRFVPPKITPIEEE